MALEPSWTRIGTISKTGTATFSTSNSCLLGGRIDLYTAVYKVENDSRSSQNNYACKLKATMWPGHQLDIGVDNFRNYFTTMSQNWDENDFGNLEIGEWGPHSSKKGHIDWSLSISGSEAGVSGGISASYETPYIERDVTSEYNRTVAHKYRYPYDIFGANPGARYEIVKLKSLGEAWMNDATNDNGEILTAEMSGTFYGTAGLECGIYSCSAGTYKPSTKTTIQCDKHSLTQY